MLSRTKFPLARPKGHRGQRSSSDNLQLVENWWRVNVLYFLDLESLILTDISQPFTDTRNTSASATKGLQPNFSKGLWALFRFFTETLLPEDFDLDLVLSNSGIIIDMVPNIVELKDHGSYELVAATSCLDLLSEKFHDFKLVADYDPFEPTEDGIRIHGICEAKKRARVNSLNNAVKAIRNGWGRGPVECYRNATGKAGLGTALEKKF